MRITGFTNGQYSQLLDDDMCGIPDYDYEQAFWNRKYIVTYLVRWIKKTEIGKMMTISSNSFFENVALIIEKARAHVGRTADMSMCMTNFEIGRLIVEEEQGGKARAEYGRGLLKELSSFLLVRVGRGFSETNLRNARKFYMIYAPSIQQLITAKLANGTKSQIQQLETAESDKSQSLTELFENPHKSYYLTDFLRSVGHITLY